MDLSSSTVFGLQCSKKKNAILTILPGNTGEFQKSRKNLKNATF